MTQLPNTEDYIEQNHERGPGWFLKIAYVVIAAFCIYYWFTYSDWKSSYETQQKDIQTQLQGK